MSYTAPMTEVPTFAEFLEFERTGDYDRKWNLKGNQYITPGMWRLLCKPLPTLEQVLRPMDMIDENELARYDDEDKSILNIGKFDEEAKKLSKLQHFRVDPSLKLDDIDLDESIFKDFDPALHLDESILKKDFADQHLPPSPNQYRYRYQASSPVPLQQPIRTPSPLARGPPSPTRHTRSPPVPPQQPIRTPSPLARGPPSPAHHTRTPSLSVPPSPTRRTRSPPVVGLTEPRITASPQAGASPARTSPPAYTDVPYDTMKMLYKLDRVKFWKVSDAQRAEAERVRAERLAGIAERAAAERAAERAAAERVAAERAAAERAAAEKAAPIVTEPPAAKMKQSRRDKDRFKPGPKDAPLSKQAKDQMQLRHDLEDYLTKKREKKALMGKQPPAAKRQPSRLGTKLTVPVGVAEGRKHLQRRIPTAGVLPLGGVSAVPAGGAGGASQRAGIITAPARDAGGLHLRGKVSAVPAGGSTLPVPVRGTGGQMRLRGGIPRARGVRPRGGVSAEPVGGAVAQMDPQVGTHTVPAENGRGRGRATRRARGGQQGRGAKTTSKHAGERGI